MIKHIAYLEMTKIVLTRKTRKFRTIQRRFKKQKKTNEMSSLCQIRQSEKNILKKKINIKKQKTSLASIRGEMLVAFWFLEQHNNLFNL